MIKRRIPLQGSIITHVQKTHRTSKFDLKLEIIKSIKIKYINHVKHQDRRA